jgi:hypothetical protein
MPGTDAPHAYQSPATIGRTIAPFLRVTPPQPNPHRTLLSPPPAQPQTRPGHRTPPSPYLPTSCRANGPPPHLTRTSPATIPIPPHILTRQRRNPKPDRDIARHHPHTSQHPDAPTAHPHTTPGHRPPRFQYPPHPDAPTAHLHTRLGQRPRSAPQKKFQGPKARPIPRPQAPVVVNIRHPKSIVSHFPPILIHKLLCPSPIHAKLVCRSKSSDY